MSQPSKSSTQLQAIEAELSEATARAHRLVGSLSPEDWSRRPAPERWSIGEQMTAELVLAALNMALEQRRPHEVIHHSDQGSQYTSVRFGERCKLMGVRPSMGTVGDAYDNAMAESFFATLEREVLNRRRFKSQAEAKMAIFDWLEGWYNPHRRHSALGRRSPVTYERLAFACEVA